VTKILALKIRNGGLKPETKSPEKLMRECSHQNYLLIASYLLHKLDALSLKRVGEVGPAYILCISLLLVKRVRPHGKDPENGKPSQ